MILDQARQLCRSLFLETLQDLKVGPRLEQAVRLQDGVLEIQGDSYPLAPLREVRVVSIGKAAVAMAEALATVLAGVRLRGLVVSPDRAAVQQARYEYFRAGHPYPDEGSWRAAQAVLPFLQGRSGDDLVVFLLSGGGSALLDKPLDPAISLEDLRRFHQVLVTCGAKIQEVNALRKHLSLVKGGRLAERAAPATQITLYLSDVPDSLPSAVASGPTMPDETTVEECHDIAFRYALLEEFPTSIRRLFESGRIGETPKPGHPCFAKSRYYCLLSNRDAVEKVLERARQSGLSVASDSGCDEWDCSRAAAYLLEKLETLREKLPGQAVALASGGELSCPVTGDGWGGRNQAFVLDCVPKIAGKPVVVLSAGTDGVDGNSPACGALADGTSAGRAAELGLAPEDFLSRGDSYHFFEKLGDSLITGPTGTNVRDLRILLAYS